MAISYIGSATANSTSLTMPTHQSGDILIGCGYNNDGTSAITVPSGWTMLSSTSGSVSRITTAYKYATSGSETSGTWTGADQLLIASYRSTKVIAVAPVLITQGGSFGTVTWDTLETTANASVQWVVFFGCVRTNDTTIDTAPSGATNRASIAGGSAGELCLHDTNGHVASWASTTTSPTGTSAAWKTSGLWIWETPFNVSGGERSFASIA